MDDQQPKWYFRTWSLVVSFLCAGPFMLPLVWKHPRFSKVLKIIITAVVLILTWLLIKLSGELLKFLTQQISYEIYTG